MIKYLGSKRRLLPILEAMAERSGATSMLDLFAGTTLVGQSFKRHRARVTAVDTASYSKVLGETFISIDATSANLRELDDAVDHLNRIPGSAGYFTENFSIRARYIQPFNGERIDAIRECIARDYAGSWLEAPLLASLLRAADMVDSTTGVQMAFLKEWSRRSFKPLELVSPTLLPGDGETIQADALNLLPKLPMVDLAYIDPPYNQHRYFGNYHVWESLIRWDKPETYGVANKRVDVRDEANRSAFNSKVTMPDALKTVLREVQAETIILSYNNESWLGVDELIAELAPRGEVRVIDVDFKRYVGSQIGIYNKSGEKVGSPGARRNLEHLIVAGPSKLIELLCPKGDLNPYPLMRTSTSS